MISTSSTGCGWSTSDGDCAGGGADKSFPIISGLRQPGICNPDHAGDGSPAGSTPAPGTNGRKPEYGKAAARNAAESFTGFSIMAGRKDGQGSGEGQPHEQRDGFLIDRLVMSINIRRIS